MNRKHERRQIHQTERKIELKPEQKENKSNYKIGSCGIKHKHGKSPTNGKTKKILKTDGQSIS